MHDIRNDILVNEIILAHDKGYAILLYLNPLGKVEKMKSIDFLESKLFSIGI